MAYNVPNYYPATYVMPSNPWQNQSAQPQNNQQYVYGVNWVLDEMEPKSAHLPPNTTAIFLDGRSNTMYVKMTDANGIPSMSIADYKFRNNNMEAMSNTQAPIDTTAKVVEPEYATKEDFMSLTRQLDSMTNSIKALSDMMAQKDDKPGNQQKHK